jgi:hypothetical protein
VTYHTVPGLNAQRVCMNLGVSTHGTQAGTYLFLTPGFKGEGIFTSSGALVWWRPRDRSTGVDADMSVVQLLGQPHLAVWSGTPDYVKSRDNFHVNDGTVLLFNEHYQQVGSITAAGAFAGGRVDMHEFRITPDGDALVGIYQVLQRPIDGRRQSLVQYVIQKVSLVRDSSGMIHTGKLLFQWRSLAHVPVSASRVPRGASDNPWDYFHGNAIAQDTDGNLIVSARNTWAIYKINATTGQIMWQVGGKGDQTLKHPWCYQHDVSPLGDDEYSLFDDGGVGPGCAVNQTQHPARGLIVRVDPTARPARVQLVAAFNHRPGIQSGYLGSTQQLPGGHVLVDWGNFPEITEYGVDGHVLMDLSLSSYSFRGLRFAWDGQPTAPPAVAAQFQGAGTRIWASWNGSTEVAAWRVLAGTSTSQPLSPVGSAIPKTGFETALLLPEPEPVVAVQALDAHGHVLATSTPVTTRS